jgi:ubiquinone/menaquinone biosynthesis C-methylase UbiE
MDSKARHEDEVRDQFTRQAEGYARMTEAYAGSHDPLELIEVGPEDVVLDVACGAGRLTLPLAARARHVTGFDLTPAMIDIARQAQARAGLTNIDWRLGSVQALPFADGAFTLVTCGIAFHHFADHAAGLAEMRRVCRPGGRVAIVDLTPSAATVDAFDRFERLRDAGHNHALTPEELRGLGRDLGLSEIVARTFRSPSAPLDAILASTFPESCTIDELRAMVLADPDAIGLALSDEGGVPCVAYQMSVVVWTV